MTLTRIEVFAGLLLAATATACVRTPQTATGPAAPGQDSTPQPEAATVAIRPAGFTRLMAQQAGLTTSQRHLIDSLCPLGEPRVDPAFGYGKTHVVTRRGYALEHSDADRIPIWVCERLFPAQLQGDLARNNPFAPDPELPQNARAELSDYRGSGFDRGHQAPAGDQTVDATLKSETFYLSNMAPQAPLLNQRIWARLENQVRAWTLARHEVWVITGPMFYDPDEENPNTADGRVDYTILNGHLSVPTHFYKLVASKRPDGRWDVLAFVLENHGYPQSAKLDQFLVPIQWLEDRAGVDLLPNLPANQANILSQAPAMWP